ncbi:TPM domain-containing protein [Mucilaginibacter rubeus]|uniref:TPM domain-containing protein n=1 Tax=Mucilaginibacter rubeus TaxID=2027860 RepID=A0AAE6MFX1_9SPHI|nr:MULTISPECIES: TPM domain-containing protein [Mucilaginibacter]QEM01985.1 TPM domain-containing protein [Mucilaginibacter rubeus]QEM14613.1 TPM domain-containing protein [Mucilaginibacter gossypii]QTE42682.1 TPM domain-containing protein [Mucilaginibacter rubeus]QTE49283.1 TPM domain-containing protein [Mucilaginibacter rubeus]QTE54380.1 TPM domain-containing protein [Mucilaginibacter rubeus]
MLKKFILFFGFTLCVIAAIAQDFPERSNTLVTDYTNTLNPADKQRLETKLVAFNDSTSTQIAVVILKSTGSYDINDYGVQLLRKWGIGQKDKNNGVLVLVAIGDRKMSIQTGYGAEGALPDIVTQDIIQNDLKPHFKQGDYYGGLDAGTNSIIKAMKGEYKAAKKQKQSNGGPAGFIVIVIVVVILILVFRNRGGGGGRQIIGRRGGASPFWWFLAGNMLGGGGRSGGGDWGGFSGGGGGFGGFGGGSGGGGGSSGSW